MAEIWIGSPLGPMRIVATDGAISALSWGGQAGASDDSSVLRAAAQQVTAYFAGERESFELPLQVGGSDFQKAVCAQMLTIPFGYTRTYGEIAKALAVPAQAVGGACGGNPIPIIIPCHRVMGAKGLTGFSGAGGVESKVWLLRHEKAGGFLI